MPLCPPLSLHVLLYSISYRPISATLLPPPSRYRPILSHNRCLNFSAGGRFTCCPEKEKQQLKELWFEEHVKKWLREEATDEAPAEEEEIVEV